SKEEHPVEMLQREYSVSLDDRGRQTTVYKARYRLLIPSPHESWKSVTATYEPWYEDRPELSARVTNPDGSEHVLAQKTVTERAESADPLVYSTRKLVSAPLPAVGMGSLIEVEVRTHEHAPVADFGVTGRF